MKIVLGVTGSISAYKACSIVSALVNKGHEVQVVMTNNAQEFITPLSLSTLSQKPVLTNEEEWNYKYGKIPHIFFPQDWADVFIIAPCTANMIAKLSLGMSDDILSSMALALLKDMPKIIYPSMNSEMLSNKVTQKNILSLRQGGWIVGQTQEKRLACGKTGKGGLEITKKIVNSIEAQESYILKNKGKE